MVDGVAFGSVNGCRATEFDMAGDVVGEQVNGAAVSDGDGDAYCGFVESSGRTSPRYPVWLSDNRIRVPLQSMMPLLMILWKVGGVATVSHLPVIQRATVVVSQSPSLKV
ncbi:hypothetical protein [Nocardia sp. NPDC049707]|uniref:hypothetical protein n=1 Tax=Nocardia sp. NPDC049707 TaxID=3154735 RepID=UPI00344449E1